MKHLIFLSTLFLLFGLLLLGACRKDAAPLPPNDEPTDRDTTVVHDTIHPVVLSKDIPVQVNELGTNLPAAFYHVILFETSSPSPNTLYYVPVDTLGQTDAQGKFVWHWAGDTLASNTFLGFVGATYSDLTERIYVGKIPANSYQGWVYTKGVLRLRIEMKKNALPFPGIEIVQFKTGNEYYQHPNWDGRALFSKTAPFDTTITLQNTAPASFAYGIRYGVDNSSYQGYISTGQTQKFTATFKAGDTLFQHLVVE